MLPLWVRLRPSESASKLGALHTLRESGCQQPGRAGRAAGIARSVWCVELAPALVRLRPSESASKLGALHTLRDFAALGSEVILHFHLVNLEAVDRFHLCRGSRSLEPRRRAPRILVGYRHQAMLHRVSVDIVEPRQVGVLVGQPRVAEVVSHGAVFDAVHAVELSGRPRVQFPQELPQRHGIRRAPDDDVVVIDQHRPRFKLPDAFLGEG